MHEVSDHLSHQQDASQPWCVLVVMSWMSRPCFRWCLSRRWSASWTRLKMPLNTKGWVQEALRVSLAAVPANRSASCLGFVQQIDEMLAGSLSQEDEDAVLAELEEITQVRLSCRPARLQLHLQWFSSIKKSPTVFWLWPGHWLNLGIKVNLSFKCALKLLLSNYNMHVAPPGVCQQHLQQLTGMNVLIWSVQLISCFKIKLC